MPHKGMVTGENSGKCAACSKYSIIGTYCYLNFLFFFWLANIFFIKYYLLLFKNISYK